LNPATSIYSFEPHPEVFKVFQKSIAENNITNITSENVAIGSEDCDIMLNLYGQTSNILNSKISVKNKVLIRQINLDNYLANKNVKPNFIKIDVDGYELNVLKGLKETITNCKPIMVIETNDDYQVLDFLKNCGYHLLDLDLKEFEGMPNNVFCIR
jgi:FkbM family methyltransferase